MEVYWDDFRVEHVKSLVIESSDYYPFGLSYNSLQRESSLNNPYQYNGKEVQDELDLGWQDYVFRMYIPEIGRWFVMDPLSEKHKVMSPYAYVLNNPISFIDPFGLDTLQTAVVTAKRLDVDPGWTSFIQELGPDGYQNFVDNYYQNKLNAYRTPFAASLYGLDNNGNVMIPEEIQEQEWEETQDEALPALAALWAMQETGEDPTSLAYAFNPLAQANFLSTYVMTGVSKEEASSILKNLGVQLAIGWVGQLQIPNPGGLSIKPIREGGRLSGFSVNIGEGYGAKPRFDVHPLRRASSATRKLSLPQWLKNGKIPIPHYHRGRGNSLKRHRPWEIKSGDGFFSRW